MLRICLPLTIDLVHDVREFDKWFFANLCGFTQGLLKVNTGIVNDLPVCYVSCKHEKYIGGEAKQIIRGHLKR